MALKVVRTIVQNWAPLLEAPLPVSGKDTAAVVAVGAAVAGGAGGLTRDATKENRSEKNPKFSCN